jgi:hypothetical protein
VAERSSRHKRRHLRAFGVLAALALGLLGLAVPAARLSELLDLPVDMAVQILSLDAMADARDILDLLSRADEAERAEELRREREAAEAAGMVASEFGTPVAYIVVKAGQSASSERSSAQVDRTAPTSPRGVAATPLSDTSIEVVWEASADDDAILGYEIVREGTAPFTASATRFMDSGLRGGTSYCYKVLAIDGSGNRSAEAGPVCATTPDILPPTAPDRVVATVQPPSTVVLSWSASEDDAGPVTYEVLDGKDVVATVTETTWIHSNAEPRKHRYSARAVDRAGNRSVDAPPAVVSLGDLEPPSTPTDVKLSSRVPTQIVVEWVASTDNRGVDKYEVLAADKVVASAGGTSAIVPSLEDWQEYCFAVRAVDSEGNRSPPTAPVCGRTIDRGAWEASRKNLGTSTSSGGGGGFYGARSRRRQQDGAAAQHAPPAVDASSATQ